MTTSKYEGNQYEYRTQQQQLIVKARRIRFVSNLLVFSRMVVCCMVVHRTWSTSVFVYVSYETTF